MSPRTPDLQDPIRWLLPEDSLQNRARARRVATFLRLLSADARPQRAEVVGLGVGRVHAELERLTRERIVYLTTILLRHSLSALLTEHIFFPLPLPSEGAGETFALWVEELRLAGKEVPWNDPEVQLRERVVGLLGVLRAWKGSGSDQVRIFEVLLAHATDGAPVAERRWRTLLKTGRPALSSFATAGVAAALMEQGRVRQASRFLETREASVAAAGAVRCLRGWAAFLTSGKLSGREETSVPLPRSLFEAFERRGPRPAACVRGAHRSAGTQPDCDGPSPGHGALVFAAFAWGAGRAVCVRWDVTPRLRGAFGAWSAAMAADLPPLETECGGALLGKTQIDERLGDEPLRGALCRRTRALVRQPIRGHDGLVRGWVHLEYDHHLVPTETWRSNLCKGLAPSITQRAQVLDATPDDPRERVAFELVKALGKRVARSRWSVFDLDASDCVAQGGGDLGSGASGTAAILRAVREDGLPHHFNRTDERSCHREAAGGCALPLSYVGRVHGALAIEWSRPVSDAEGARSRWCAIAARFGGRWRAGQFEKWHLERFGQPVSLSLEPVDDGASLAALAIAARRRETIGIVGPPGVARVVLARWLHFEGPGTQAPLLSLAAGSETEIQSRLRGFARGTLMLNGALLTASVGASLRERRQRERDLPRDQHSLLILLGRNAGDFKRLPGMEPRHLYEVPPLCRRPAELRRIAELLAGAESMTPAGWEWLTQHPFEGNLPELASVIGEAKRRARGRALTADLLRRAAQLSNP